MIRSELLAGVVVLAAWGAVGSGCSTSPSAAPASSRAELEVFNDPELRERFAAARGFLEGMDPVESGAEWRKGDRVLLGIAVDGVGPPQEWYLHVIVMGRIPLGEGGQVLGDSATFRTSLPGGRPREVTASFDLVAMKVQLLDGQLKMVSDTTSMMPEIGLRYGLSEFIRLERAGQSVMSEANDGPTVGGRVMASEVQLRGIAGMMALMRFPEFVQGVPSVNGLVWKLIRSPSLGSIIIHRGGSLSVGIAPAQARECAPPAGISAPCFQTPVSVEVNGRAAVNCEILVGSAEPPLGACNGLLAVEASHPDHPERRLRVRLLAAKRGPAH